MRIRRLLGIGAVLVGVVSVTAACSSSSPGKNGAISLVAATDVYGNIASQIVGRSSAVDVTSVISNPNQDPHTYEASARTQLALSEARIVIENGGGYDDFMGRMLAASGSHPTVINVVKLSGKTAPASGTLNEHVWYDFPTIERFTAKLVAALASVDPHDKATFVSNAKVFLAKVARLATLEASLKAAHHGEAVAITEPVPLYMLQACGLVNDTPPAFSAAVENGTDVSPRVLEQTEQLFANKTVKLLAYNEQAVGPQTKVVLSAAKAHGIPVVPVTETLPAGDSYQSWMAANLEAIGHALGGSGNR